MSKLSDSESSNRLLILRRLMIKLVEVDGPPDGFCGWPYLGNEPTSDAEMNLCGDFLMGHIHRHASRDDLKERCPFADADCKALGAAMAADILVGASTEDHHLAPVLNARKALSQLHTAIDTAEAALRELRLDCEHRHRNAWHFRHPHEAFCEGPQHLLPELQRLRLRIDRVEAESLNPRLPVHMQMRFNRGPIAVVEATLSAHGWTPAEILELSGETHVRGPAANKDRLGHRIASFFFKITATT